MNDRQNHFRFHKGDRVKFKYARNTGTVERDQQDGSDVVTVMWDHHLNDPLPRPIWEDEDDLIVLYAPRDTDPVNPNQSAIDLIEAQRTVLKKQIEDLQSRLGDLTRAKKLLERG